MEILNKSYQVGFGCATISSLNNRSKAIGLLSHAYDEGITHFDVARLYGMGATESILGEFAKDKRDKITITSKFGLNPPAFAAKNKMAISAIKSLVKKIPGLKKLAAKTIHAAVVTDFTISNAEKSLEKSLGELGTDYIDHYLLHEATPHDANNEGLIFFLEQKMKEGKIRDYGIGSAYQKLNGDCAAFDDKYSLFQFDSNILNTNILQLNNRENKLMITHSALQELKTLERNIALQSDDVIKTHSAALDIDLHDKNLLPGMMLYHSCLLNPGGVTLFSSTTKEHISANMKSLSQFNRSNITKEAFTAFAVQLKNDNIE